jgi:endo-1,4-beta-mannosidase
MSSVGVIEGTVVRFYTSSPFTNVSGTAADPDEVIFAFQVGSNPVQQIKYGTPTAYGTITKDSTGTYHVDVDTTGLPGAWTWTWAGIGTVQVRTEGQLLVSPATVAVTP